VTHLYCGDVNLVVENVNRAKSGTGVLLQA
jgi:hypothetical protein